MRTFQLFVGLLFLSGSIQGQQMDKKQQDKDAIKSMCGCFDVKFNFAETFNYSDDSLYMPSKTKHDKGLEMAILVEDSANKIVIQHLLLVGPPGGEYIIKHWRQDWMYENTDLLSYEGDNYWSYHQHDAKDVQGQWTQKVFQVDDSPRYEGTSTWVHVDGKSYWENSTYAPLPRREKTTRSDYNVMLRNNRHEITGNGWVHDQDNKKIVREDGSESILAEEKGYNTYAKLDDAKCQAAVEWWKENETKWASVRKTWDEIFNRKSDLKLAAKVDNKLLYKYLFDEEMTDDEDMAEVIQSFVKK